MKRISVYGPGLLVLATTIAVLAGGPAAVRRITYAHTDAMLVQARQRMAESPVLEQINEAYRDIARVVEPSVVHISTETVLVDQWGTTERRSSSGSGWVYDMDGHIVTNYHVVEDSIRREVQMFDGTIREAEIIGADPQTDIAVLKVREGQLHPAKRRMNDDPVQQGDMVFAFGSPFDFRFSMSSGVISGQGRSVGVIRDENNNANGYENFIQVDAAINPGNSGGPLTDFRGRVIGMNTAIATGPRGRGNYDNGQFAGIGLAIPMDMIEPVVTQLIENGVVTKGYLGLRVLDRSSTLLLGIGILGFEGFGAYVGHIDADHPVLEAGLQAGDVITNLDGRRITTVNQLKSMTAYNDLPETVELTIWRFLDRQGRGEHVTIRVFSRLLRNMRGIKLVELEGATVGEVVKLLGFEGRGVFVARLEVGRPAMEGGIERGDMITHINDRAIESVPQLRAVVSSIRPGSDVHVKAWRYDQESNTGKIHEFTITLAELDTILSRGQLPNNQRTDQILELGIEQMVTATPEIARRLNIQWRAGVLLLAIDPRSPLSRDVEQGSIIVEVAGRSIRSVEEFVEELRRKDLRSPYGVPVMLVLPDGSTASDVRLRLIQ